MDIRLKVESRLSISAVIPVSHISPHNIQMQEEEGEEEQEEEEEEEEGGEEKE